MLLLGFSSGLPFLLVGNTFGYWLRDEHTSLHDDRVSFVGGHCLFAEVSVGALDGSRRLAVV